MRCDIHVHSYYSGPVNQPALRHVGRDSYAAPARIYAAARSRGMDLVTISDHDSIEGALQLAGRPDFFMSEEVTCVLEAEGGGRPRVLHLGVLGITESQAEAIAARRTDPTRLVAFLEEQRIAWCVNHLFSPLTGERRQEDFAFALAHARALEVRNGMMPAISNAFAARVAAARGLGAVGGSDGHTVASVGRTFTAVGGANSAAEFLEGIRAGRAVARGLNGSAALLTREVLINLALGYAENLRRAHRGRDSALKALALLACAPLLPLVPFATALLHGREVRGATRLFAEFARATGLEEIGEVKPPRASPALPPSLARLGEYAEGPD